MHVSIGRLRARAEIDALALRLVAEYSGRLPAGGVLTCVARCSEELRRSGSTSNLLAETEARARAELDLRIPAHIDAEPTQDSLSRARR